MSNTSHPSSRSFFGYNIRDMRASIFMENEWPSQEQLGWILVHFPANFILSATVALGSFSRVAPRSSSRASATNFTLLSSVDFISLPDLGSLSAHTTTTKMISPTRNRITIHCELTTNFTQSTMGLCGIFTA